MATVIAFEEKTPDIHPTVFIAEGARIVGNVVIGKHGSVWFNAVIRGDVHWVRMGQSVNVQDSAVLHVTHDTAPLTIGSEVTVGHGAIVHGCTIGDGCLIGMGAIVLDGTKVGDGTLIAAGSVVRERSTIPPGVLVAGNPAVVKRNLTSDEQDGLIRSARRYVAYAQTYIQTTQER